jgi:hypothetical protein
MEENEFLVHHLVAERLRETRADATRRALLVRVRRYEAPADAARPAWLARGRYGRGTERPSGFAIAAKIVENAWSGLMNAHRRAPSGS